jgi:hypothetical protein
MDLTKVLLAATGNNNNERVNAEAYLKKLEEQNLVSLSSYTKANISCKPGN